jgi:hypothetical protein
LRRLVSLTSNSGQSRDVRNVVQGRFRQHRTSIACVGRTRRATRPDILNAHTHHRAATADSGSRHLT